MNFTISTERDQKILPSEFLSALCHELKTPLNAIIGFSAALEDELHNPAASADCADYAQEISIAANELNELIHDLLDVGQVCSGDFSVDLTKEIDPTDAIMRSIKLNHDYALKRNIQIKTSISADIKPIKLDAKRMKQILTNLISNAVKYSPRHSEIKIICKNSDGFLEISVIDQGFGMSTPQIQTAFQKYQTIQNPNSDSVDSFGLGLPITKHLVEQQNGVIEVNSIINEGTEMKIKFPQSM